MAVNENDQPIAPGSSGMSQAAPAPQPTQQAQQPRPQARVGARNINSVLGRPFAKSAINETLQLISKHFNEFLELEVSPNDPGFKVLVIDNKQSLTALSAIALCYCRRRAGFDYVTVHTMLVEGGAKLNNRTIQNNGQNIEIITVAGDVADSEMSKRVSLAVQESYGRSDLRIAECGGNVIYSELDVADKNSLRYIFGNAIQACYQGMVNEGVIDEAPFNASLIGGGDNLVAYLDLHPRKLTNSSGLPVRSDVSIQLQAVVQQSSQSQPEQVIGMTQVDGFVDLVYVPAAASPPGQYNAFYQPNPQRYAPRFVITNFASLLEASTMELQLLALASANILAENTGGVAPWMNTFKPRPIDKGETDLRDIGAVGLEVNFTGDPNSKPSVIDTKSNTFSQQDLYRLINTAIYPNPIFSIDVEEVSDLSYLTVPIWLSCNPALPAGQAALANINRSLNALTNNNFEQAWAKASKGNISEAYFFDDNNRIFTGYYIDKNGEKQDIRKLDYLAILNMVGRKDASFIKEWSDTFDRRDLPVEVRLEKRRRIYDTLLPGQFVIKGYARRITVNPRFMEALAVACRDSRLTFRPSNLNMDYYTGTEHGIANAHMLYGVTAGQNTGLFSYGAVNQGQQGNSFQIPGFTGIGRNW